MRTEIAGAVTDPWYQPAPYCRPIPPTCNSSAPNPISVYTGSFEIGTRFKAPATAMPGMAFMNGKLRYQACNNKECLPPRTVDVRVTLDIQ